MTPPATLPDPFDERRRGRDRQRLVEQLVDLVRRLDQHGDPGAVRVVGHRLHARLQRWLLTTRSQAIPGRLSDNPQERARQ
jgi:hypothetical protein